MICIDAEHLQDGLYNIKNGKIYKYRAKGGTSRVYKLENRSQGEWIEQEDDYHHYLECSECGMGVGLDDIRNYCPNCGAKMKGADDDNDNA